MTGSKESSMSMSAFQAATKRLRAAFPEIWKAVYAEERVARGLPPSPASPEERAARGREIAIRRVMQLPPEDRAAVIAALQQEDQS